jgi:lysophospholipid acyltransferase (LPLAT)-like uncharacterized protein
MWPLSLVLRLWWSTIRMEMAPADLAVITRQGHPILFVLWHNRLFMTPEIVRRFRGGHPLYGLISASKDGDWLAALFTSVGLGAIRGSSSRFGREAVGAVVEALNSGRDVGITPDGPRGPLYVMKPGALVFGRRTSASVALVGMDFGSAWRLRSWDGFYLPRPFSRIQMRFEFADVAGLDGSENAARSLAARLSAMNPDRTSVAVRRKA